jgi:hypothetical protein
MMRPRMADSSALALIFVGIASTQYPELVAESQALLQRHNTVFLAKIARPEAINRCPQKAG